MYLGLYDDLLGVWLETSTNHNTSRRQILPPTLLHSVLFPVTPTTPLQSTFLPPFLPPSLQPNSTSIHPQAGNLSNRRLNNNKESKRHFGNHLYERRESRDSRELNPPQKSQKTETRVQKKRRTRQKHSSRDDRDNPRTVPRTNLLVIGDFNHCLIDWRNNGLEREKELRLKAKPVEVVERKLHDISQGGNTEKGSDQSNKARLRLCKECDVLYSMYIDIVKHEMLMRVSDN